MTKEAVMLAVFGGAKSLSGIFQALGGKGNVSGSTTKKLREMIPGIADMLEDNKAGNPILKNSLIAQALKLICPEEYEKHFPKAVKSTTKTPKADKAPKAPKVKGKDRIVMTYQKTGNPFKASSMKAVFFTYASKGFKAFPELKEEVANDPLFMELCKKANKGVEMPLEARMKRVDWQRDMTKASHANSLGATDIIKDEEGKIKAVCLV
jgi:hypothetical protein